MAVGTPMIGFHVLQGIGLPLRMNGVGTPWRVPDPSQASASRASTGAT